MSLMVGLIEKNFTLLNRRRAQCLLLTCLFPVNLWLVRHELKLCQQLASYFVTDVRLAFSIRRFSVRVRCGPKSHAEIVHIVLHVKTQHHDARSVSHPFPRPGSRREFQGL